MKIGVVVFPHGSCDKDLKYVLKEIMEVGEVVDLWHKDQNLNDVDAIIMSGTFSYGDHLKSRLNIRYSPILHSIIEYAKKGGFVFGFGSCFQLLCETGLLPGALLENMNDKFISQNVYLKVVRKLIDTDYALKLPVANREGRYFVEEDVLGELYTNKQIIMQYCTEDGELSQEANPNGSLDSIAGVCNKERNVFGLMPHPERASDDELGNTDGLHIFDLILETIRGES